MIKTADTNILVRGGRLPFNPQAPPSVREEIQSDKGQRNLDLEQVKFVQPGNESLRKVRSISEDINSPTSGTDEDVVALALETGTELVSDDLAVQNLAAHLEIEFSSYMNDEINELREWEVRCERCGRKMGSVDESCSMCGGGAERRTSSREML